MAQTIFGKGRKSNAFVLFIAAVFQLNKLCLTTPLPNLNIDALAVQPTDYTKSTELVLPLLPYAYNSLEPYICEEIMVLHHDKHHAKYVDDYNKAIKDLKAAQVAKDSSKQKKLESIIKFSHGGHILHSAFWLNLLPASQGGGRIKDGPLLKLIIQKFKSFEGFKTAFSTAALAIQGSGWAILAYNPNLKQLEIATTANQNLLLDLKPILFVDMWEHAYYLQNLNVKADYINNIFFVINWDKVSKRLLEA